MAAPAGRPAPDLCRQEIYDEFLAVLRGADLEPGTIVVDDRWQAAYGTAEVDTEAWPDLRGLDRRAPRRRAASAAVVEGMGSRRTAGRASASPMPRAAPVAADPGSRAYRERVDAIVERLLGSDGLDADGFKVDFTQRAPSGTTLRSAPDSDGVWGIAALHRLVARIHAAAKRAKPDALVVTHTVHPSFGDVSDMIRTNDVLEEGCDGSPVSVAEQLRVALRDRRRAPCRTTRSTPTSGRCPVTRSGWTTRACRARSAFPRSTTWSDVRGE